MILNQIHQIWIGPRPLPSKWLDTWDSKVYRDEDIEDLHLVNQEKYDYYYKNKNYAGATDIARVEIIYRYGGVYMDADSYCLNPIDELLDNEFFAGIEYDDRVANGVFGATPEHPILKDYIDRINKATVLDPACYTVGGTLFTTCIDLYGRDKVTILPQYAFYPKWKHRGEIKGKIYARHMWGTTKNAYEG